MIYLYYSIKQREVITTIKKTVLTDSDYDLIEELFDEAENYTKEEFQEIINEQFECDKLKDELLELNKCPSCSTPLETKITGWQDTYEVWGSTHVHNEYQTYCPNCNWVNSDN